MQHICITRQSINYDDRILIQIPPSLTSLLLMPPSASLLLNVVHGYPYKVLLDHTLVPHLLLRTQALKTLFWTISKGLDTRLFVARLVPKHACLVHIHIVYHSNMGEWQIVCFGVVVRLPTESATTRLLRRDQNEIKTLSCH